MAESESDARVPATKFDGIHPVETIRGAVARVQFRRRCGVSLSIGWREVES